MNYEMVEVFKTNVEDPDQAAELLNQIHKNYTEYKANFDLEDCDKILRVQCNTGDVQSSFLIQLLKDYGFHSEVLSDELIL